ncbi:GlxA family transcriptional regulator [Pseudomonas plecoglossicida]|uniref:AraC family transcriptional regulator n=1 Tax=Pseudomonas plecoglossicida TaxID=70775 RepID=A0AAD0VSE1_PSEDL|nr:helix-turn-helix domain-containing protein [Pseudomonas plecoglossicida]AXM94917.1 AraC family transcriptional regulator [Pseudomonas plecoglossicida]EPB94056.1 AraC family transcriptional regulator [Pseudomonas plecoglossicida NB2011]QLB55658.1 helix-turn-helix domain-containing protein [Pseudomonas plecoglossicida]
MSHFESILKNTNLAHLDPASRDALSLPCRRVAFTAAMDTLVTANLMSATPLFLIQVVGEGAQVMSDLGIALPVTTPLAELQLQGLDSLLVCGGLRVRLEPSALLRSKLRHAEQFGCQLGGLWNGAYFLAEAGLLNDHDCAFHPDGRAMMSELFPKVRISRQAHVLDRRRMSCAGASSALDMMLALLEQQGGEGLRRAVEQMLACDRARGAGDLPASAPEIDPSLPRGVRLALELMHANIEDPIGIDEIAEHAGLSRRHLERLFRRHVQATPPRYYLELRLTHARQLLQHTSKSLTEVAVASGFVSFPHFYRRFRELFAIAPRQFRARSQGWVGREEAVVH